MGESRSKTSMGFLALVAVSILGLSSCGGDPNISSIFTTIATPSTDDLGSDSTNPTDETSPTDETGPTSDGVEDTTKPTDPPQTTIAPTTTSPQTTTSSPPTSSDLKTMACLDQGGRVQIDESMMMAYCYVDNKIFDRWGIK